MRITYFEKGSTHPYILDIQTSKPFKRLCFTSFCNRSVSTVSKTDRNQLFFLKALKIDLINCALTFYDNVLSKPVKIA